MNEEKIRKEIAEKTLETARLMAELQNRDVKQMLDRQSKHNDRRDFVLFFVLVTLAMAAGMFVGARI